MSDKNIAKSASRAFDILVHFSNVRRPERAANIADALHLPRSSTDQLLKTLVNTGYLIFFSDEKTYFPSLRLHAASDWIAKTYAAQAGLGALLAELHEETGEVTTLAMQNDCYMQIVDSAGAIAPIKLPPALPSMRVPIVGTAVGGAALVTKNFSEVQKIVSRARRVRAGADRPEDFKELPQRLTSYRSAGYAWSRRPLPGTAERGPKGEMMSLAVPLPRHFSGAPMVVGMAGPAHRILSHERDLVHAIKSRMQSYLASNPALA